MLMNDMTDSDFIIPSESKGLRFDAVLAKHFPSYSRSLLSRHIKEGKITLNDHVVKPKEILFGGENVCFLTELSLQDNPENQAQPENIPLNILYEDEYLMVINKPAGLVVHPGAGNPHHTLVNALLHYQPELNQLPRAGIVHRLDKDTTGLLLIAKTLNSYTQLSRMMQNREIHRNYIALVHGHVIAGGRLETGYGRDPRNRIKKAVTPNGRTAITEYRISKSYRNCTLLNVSLHTGRTHQIRVHMAHIKHPIIGDPLYGKILPKFAMNTPSALKNALLHFKRQALHAIQLSFIHPFLQKGCVFKADIPDDLLELFEQLESETAK